jgi:hypothetical protein
LATAHRKTSQLLPISRAASAEHQQVPPAPENRRNLVPLAAQREQQADEDAGPDGAVAQHVHRRDVRQLAEEERKESPHAVGEQAAADAGQWAAGSRSRAQDVERCRAVVAPIEHDQNEQRKDASSSGLSSQPEAARPK